MTTVLLVEDDAIISRLYQFAFERAGIQVKVAGDGDQALQSLEAGRPDLVVLDLMLPKVHGIEVIRQIRARQATQTVPIIVLSNTFLTTMMRAAWQAGANQCMTKAECSPERLVQVVRETLGLAKPELGSSPASPAMASEAPEGSTAFAPPPRSRLLTAETGGTARPETAGDTAVSPLPERAMGAPSLAPAPRRAKSLITPGTETSILRIPTSLEETVQRLERTFPSVMETLRGSLPKIDQRLLETQLLPGFRELTAGLQTWGQLTEAPSCGSLKRIGLALHALLSEIIEDPAGATASTYRTLIQGSECFLRLLAGEGKAASEKPVYGLALVVDDDIVSRRTVSSALESAELRSISTGDPQLSLRLLEENNFDLIVLDVEMPGMSGFDLCNKLRTLPNHKSTPVVFVTALGSYENRARSILSGGNHIIAKPFLMSELGLKSLTLILKVPGKAGG